MNKDKIKSKASVFSIRMQLLWIWFLKNLTVFLKLAIIICIILIFFGVITFGGNGIIDIIFSDVMREWEEAQRNGFETFEKVIASILSLGISVIMIMRKTRSITIKDIKSRKLKIAMLKANLYFNEHGKLCRKLETTTKMDLNGDGKVGDTDLNEIPEEITAVGVVRAVSELATILTTPIDPNGTEDKVVEDSELSDEVDDEIVEINEKLYTEDAGVPESVEEVQVDEESEDDEYDMDKELDKPFILVRVFRNVIGALKMSKTPKLEKEKKTKKIKKKKHEDISEEESEKTLVEVVNTEKTPSLFENEEKVVEKDLPVENIKPEVKPETPVLPQPEKQVAPKAKVQQSAKSKQINDILNSLK